MKELPTHDHNSYYDRKPSTERLFAGIPMPISTWRELLRIEAVLYMVFNHESLLQVQILTETTKDTIVDRVQELDLGGMGKKEAGNGKAEDQSLFQTEPWRAAVWLLLVMGTTHPFPGWCRRLRYVMWRKGVLQGECTQHPFYDSLLL